MRVFVKNIAVGARMLLLGNGGGVTIPAGGTSPVDIADDDDARKGFEAQIKDQEDVFQIVDDPEEGEGGAGISQIPSTSFNATPSSDGGTTPLGSNLEGGEGFGDTRPPLTGGEGDGEQLSGLTNVAHRGFGRWYGMRGEEVVTEAMTRAEAEALAQEHKVPLGDEPDPTRSEQSGADNTPPEENPPPPDETNKGG